jgi:hypothetical protein
MSAGITKVNPVIDATRGRSFTGATLNCFTVDIVAAVNLATANMGPTGAYQAILSVLSRNCTIVGVSALRTNGTGDGRMFDVLVEGEFGTEKYDNTNSETLAEFLQTVVRDLATVNSVSLTLATVVVKTGFPMFTNNI